jgi:hypothetical protein
VRDSVFTPSPGSRDERLTEEEVDDGSGCDLRVRVATIALNLRVLTELLQDKLTNHLQHPEARLRIRAILRMDHPLHARLRGSMAHALHGRQHTISREDTTHAARLEL